MKKEKKLMELIKKEDKNISGFLDIKETADTILVFGSLSTSSPNIKKIIDDFVSAEFPFSLFSNAVEIKNGLTVTVKGETASTDSGAVLDEVKTLFQGDLPIGAISSSNKFKVLNQELISKIHNVVRVLNYIEPIVLDNELSIINGNHRLEVAKMLSFTKIPVVVLDVNGLKADFLRLALNRTSEFQRWNYEPVDEYVDTIPQVQPLLEPIGFFGNKLLPESFFSDSMLNYQLDVFNNQQQLYRQESTIEEWANLRKKEILENEQKAKAKKEEKNKKPTMSLFDLKPDDSDFIETYDVKAEINKNVEEMKELADKVTTEYDKVRKAEMEAKGQVWQNSRRNTKEVAADNRTELLTLIEESNLSSDKKSEIVEKLDTFSSLSDLKQFIKEELKDE